MNLIQSLPILAVGLLAGILSGLFGIGGGVIVVPALIYLFRFTEHQAAATSLAALLPPVAILGVMEHWKMGNVKVFPASLICLGILFGARWGARLTADLSGAELRLAFGAFVTLLGILLVVTALRKI